MILPREFHDVAKHLSERRLPSAGEATHRTVVGRAYYAAFLATREALRAQYQSPAYDVHHDQLANELASHRDPDVRGVGTRLQTLKRLRTQADYEPADTLGEFDADDSVQDAADVLRLLPAAQPKLPRVTPKAP